MFPRRIHDLAMVLRRPSPVLLGTVLITVFGVVAPSGAAPADESPVHRLEITPGEDGPRRAVRVDDWRIQGRAPSAPVTRRSLDPDSLAVSGRVLFGDRLFDRNGYTGGTVDLPVRRATIKMHTIDGGTVIAEARTEEDGSFELRAEAVSGSLGVVLSTEARTSAGGILRVVDAQGMVHGTELGRFEGGPGLEVDFGERRVPDLSAAAPAGAVHVLDLSLSAVDLVETTLDGWPRPLPAARYDPGAEADARTGAAGPDVVVASPASGNGDAWSDGIVLAAWGERLLLDLGAGPAGDLFFAEGLAAPPEAFVRAASWAFAGAVRDRRSEQRVDAAGAPLAGSPPVLVDLPTAPPPGFPVPADAVLDLEAATLGPAPRPVLPRGQASAPALAAQLWETIDGVGDDPVDGSRVDHLQILALVAGPAAVFEDFHDAWLAAFDDPAWSAFVIAQAGCALEVDAFEPDDPPGPPPPATVWTQPPLDPAGGVVVNEVHLGARDGVELFNAGVVAVDLSGWSVRAARAGFSDLPERTVVLPAGATIGPGRAVVLLEGTSADERSPVDLPAPDWNVPWAADADGAVILRDAGGMVVDFVRWAGRGGDAPSTEPVPPGTGFGGVLVAPSDERFALGRDSSGSDTDAAADFSPRMPTPGWPNVADVRAHTLRPRGDVDRFTVTAPGPVEVHARRTRDTGRPRLGADAATSATTQPGIGADGAGALLALRQSSAVQLRSADASPVTSSGLQVFAWEPVVPLGLFAVEDLRATAAGTGLFADSVRIRWTVPVPTDSLRILEDGTPIATLAGDATSLDLFRPLGRYRYTVEPRVSGIGGTPRTTGVHVGPVSCDTREDFLATGVQFEEPVDEFFVDVDVPFASEGSVLWDRPAAQASYADADTATATLRWVTVPTTGSSITLEHAVHLAGDGDHARLLITRDDGWSWEELARWDGTEHDGSGDDPADWTDGVLQPGDLLADRIDLTPFAGERVRFRLQRSSDDSGTSLGWSIDAITLEIGGVEGEVHVAVDGSDDLGCGVPERPWATIEPALDAVTPGGTIVLGAGEFDFATGASGAVVDLPAGVGLRGAGADASRLVVDPDAVAVRVAGPGPPTRVVGLRIEGGRAGLEFTDVEAVLDSLQVDRADTAIVVRGAPVRLDGVVLSRGAVGLHAADTTLELRRSTLADLGTGVITATGVDSVVAERVSIARCDMAALRAEGPAPVVRFACGALSDVGQGFEGADVTVVPPLVTFAPRHCDAGGGIYTLAKDSPLLDVDGCGTIGALGLACAAPAPTAAPPAASALRLERPRPNPFNPRTVITFELPRTAAATLVAYDPRGRRVADIVDAVLPAGRHRVVWSGEDDAGRPVASGVYFLRLEAAGEGRTVRATLVR